jgi:hypothetical protein
MQSWGGVLVYSHRHPKVLKAHYSPLSLTITYLGTLGCEETIKGELPICLLGGHGAHDEIIPRDFLSLDHKSCLTFLGDQPTAVMHRQIGSECMSKL